MVGNLFENLYRDLKRKYGKPNGQWGLWCKRPKAKEEKEEIVIGSILAQRTSWKNVELAINNLKRAKLNSLKDIYQAGPEKVSLLIKPSGFYRAKARYLFTLAKFIVKNYRDLEGMEKVNFKKLREELLNLRGVGPETADSILLYALDKPIFLIDEYTRRFTKKKKLSQNLSYDFLQKLFERNLPSDHRLYQDIHALIVIDGKNKKS